MNWRQQHILSNVDREIFSATIMFLEQRLEKYETINWALTLSDKDLAQKMAIAFLLDHPTNKVSEPWYSAWCLIEEYWKNNNSKNSDIDVYRLTHRIKKGERSGALISAITELVAARLQIESFEKHNWSNRKLPRKPKTVRDVFYSTLTSGHPLDPKELGIHQIKKKVFLNELAQNIEASVLKGLAIAKRLGWKDETRFWALGDIRRVYYVHGSVDEDPDQYAEGIAASVKLLHSTVYQLSSVSVKDAQKYVNRWKFNDSPLFMRLWASMATNRRIAQAKEVEAFFDTINTEFFWNLHRFPEIAELRAARFGDLEKKAQKKIIDRIKRLPPKSHWPKNADPDKLPAARLYWALRELRRIEMAGHSLPDSAKQWLEHRLPQHSDLKDMVSIEEGFLSGPTVRAVGPSPDIRYDSLEGEERLRTLEKGLVTGRNSFDDDPSRGASDWIRKDKNTLLLLSDFEHSDSVDNYPNVWDRFGWSHNPKQETKSSENISSKEAKRVLKLLKKLSPDTIKASIDGITHWLSVWSSHSITEKDLELVWFRIWPIAVEATNAVEYSDDENNLGAVAKGGTDDDPMDLDTLNIPVGRMFNVFFEAWKNTVGDQPFTKGTLAKKMRDRMISASGRSELIVKYRMIEFIDHFLNADLEWSTANLIPELMKDSSEIIPLWRAVARMTRSSRLIRILGNSIIQRALDVRLAREARRSVVFSIIIECLNSFYKNGESAIPHSSIQQMLRSLEDEVRSFAAEAIHRFVRDNSKSAKNGLKVDSEELFKKAAKPFLQTVWPQERALSTPGVSQALADLPAASGDAFAEAVETIERFLVPFKTWSLIEYGLYGNEKDDETTEKLSRVNTLPKAKALLILLDRTIGKEEGSVIPYDLGKALSHIRQLSPNSANTTEFRRLAAAARIT